MGGGEPLLTRGSDDSQSSHSARRTAAARLACNRPMHAWMASSRQVVSEHTMSRHRLPSRKPSADRGADEPTVRMRCARHLRCSSRNSAAVRGQAPAFLGLPPTTPHKVRSSSAACCGSARSRCPSRESLSSRISGRLASRISRGNGTDPSGVDPSGVDPSGGDPSSGDRPGGDPSGGDRPGGDPSGGDRPPIRRLRNMARSSRE